MMIPDDDDASFRYGRHSNLQESLEKVKNRELVLTESKQVLQYSIQQNYTM